ncbi:hypothetical protein TNCV_4854331 [Trichonephila clavipes]|nr:hypothetical protein TNCV_4854331 [Trichonephila clavipes]
MRQYSSADSRPMRENYADSVKNPLQHTARHRVTQRKWAAEHRDWMQSEWSQVPFTDKSGFRLEQRSPNFLTSRIRFQECDEDVEKPRWHAMQKTGFQMLNDDEIVTSVQEESDPFDDETDEDEDNNNNESSNDSSNANTFSVLETDMEWYEQQ